MLWNLIVSEGTQAEALTDSTLKLKDGNSEALIVFNRWEEMELVADNLINMAQALRNKEFEVIGTDKE